MPDLLKKFREKAKEPNKPDGFNSMLLIAMTAALVVHEKIAHQKKFVVLQFMNIATQGELQPRDLMQELDELVTLLSDASEEVLRGMLEEAKSYEEKLKRDVLRAIVNLSQADGKFDLEEIYRMIEISNYIGLSKEQLDSAMECIIDDAKKTGLDIKELRNAYEDALDLCEIL